MHPHFKEEDTEAQRPKVIQPVIERASVPTWAAWHSSPSLMPPCYRYPLNI